MSDTTRPINTGDIYETVVEFVRGDKEITVSSTDSTWARRLLKLCHENPEETRIVAENSDGSVCVKLPKKYLKLSRPATRTMTDEQRKASAERLKAIRSKSTSSV